ncbi:hypothetical protein AcW2_004878 [Taiwanofungus camphoratus]|nr:hypothetical protein AcW2_004878 [Antrodia cinnamomea]
MLAAPFRRAPLRLRPPSRRPVGIPGVCLLLRPYPLRAFTLDARPAPNPTPPSPPRRRVFARARTAVRVTLYLLTSAVVGGVVVISAIFVHDAFTYTERHIDGVPVSPLALHPDRGGPKNLPVIKALLSDMQDEQNALLVDKPHLVIVGGGWGAVGVLQTLSPGDYHVTVVSPETYTTFTPLLPSAAVGTVQVRSLVEPLRKIVARLHGHLLCARAVDLVMSDRLLEVETARADGSTERIYVPYDKLVIAVGSTSSTHGVPGLEHCFQLKTVADSRLIRKRIIDNFETASLPTTSPEERRRLLSFVVCGGGPTGVETAAEIYDLCQEDIMNYYPKICREEVSIHLIQSREHILNTYSEAISRYAEQRFLHSGIHLITSARVAAVHGDRVVYTTRAPDGTTERHEVPTNFVLWSTGIAMNPFSERVSNLLPNQVHRKAIVTDAHLRIKGAPVGELYAIGDASTIETSVVSYLLDLVDEADKNKDGKIDYEEWEVMGVSCVSLRSRARSSPPRVTHRAAAPRSQPHQGAHTHGGGAAAKGPRAVRPVRLGRGQQPHPERARGAPAGGREQDHRAPRHRAGRVATGEVPRPQAVPSREAARRARRERARERPRRGRGRRAAVQVPPPRLPRLHRQRGGVRPRRHELHGRARGDVRVAQRVLERAGEHAHARAAHDRLDRAGRVGPGPVAAVIPNG